MNISKDVYEYLTNFIDDKTIINMLSVNKRFNKIVDENFFKRVLERKYPMLIPFKEKTQSWKDFYLEMVYYLSKLEEEYGIPYIPTKDYDPKKFYKVYKKYKTIYNGAMTYAASGGHMDIVKLKIHKGSNNLNIAMSYAAEEGHMDIVKSMIQKGADYFNGAMFNAAEGGHMDIVK